jgi:hypothetical protein
LSAEWNKQDPVLCAPFRFDMLDKVIKVRSSVKPQERTAGATAK